MGLVVGNEDDAHAPPCVGRQEATELGPREFAVVDVDDGFVVRCGFRPKLNADSGRR